MRLFKYEGYKLTISEEAMLLKPFKAIWKRDRTQNKEKALMELRLQSLGSIEEIIQNATTFTQVLTFLQTNKHSTNKIQKEIVNTEAKGNVSGNNIPSKIP